MTIVGRAGMSPTVNRMPMPTSKNDNQKVMKRIIQNIYIQIWCQCNIKERCSLTSRLVAGNGFV